MDNNFTINAQEENVLFTYWIENGKCYTQTIANDVPQMVQQISEADYTNALEIYHDGLCYGGDL